MHALKNGIRILCLALAFCGCVSAEGRLPASLVAKKAASDDSVYYVRVAPARSGSQDTERILFAAARQIAIRNAVTVRYTVTGGDPAAKKETIMLDFDQNVGMGISDRLKILETNRSGEGTEALVKLIGNAGFRKASVSPNSRIGTDGNPKWVSAPPKSSKCFAAVGSARQAEAADTYVNADTLAFGRLAALVAKPSVSGTGRIYQAEMHGAYIARRWYNASEKRWYSLAVLPR